jgi:hypothetical protein
MHIRLDNENLLKLSIIMTKPIIMSMTVMTNDKKTHLITTINNTLKHDYV